MFLTWHHNRQLNKVFSTSKISKEKNIIAVVYNLNVCGVWSKLTHHEHFRDCGCFFRSLRLLLLLYNNKKSTTPTSKKKRRKIAWNAFRMKKKKIMQKWWHECHYTYAYRLCLKKKIPFAIFPWFFPSFYAKRF